ncbi:hypothetical protein Sdia_34740 [Streptomyces diastaticus subsp. diastaticus]|uniref:Uncharacterized protein n=1 Tax=Streptomyces diastaticus subsp. diastaticus TaxID=68040 RepID=A0ABQ1CQR0_STRDI|nr:hypothetical protein Sdia_34740 [Streptomyces diastaticus subsp. diastaticus]GGU24266.1 hypothetical protein GCM10015534_28910 [Streptomyces diastaticus subsp. diastaticus]
MHLEVYAVDCMTERWEIETEPEVRDWLELLPFRLYRRVENKTADCWKQPTTLGEPYSRHPGWQTA